MPSRWQKLKSTLASYYREYEFVTAIYVLEPWEKRWANGMKKQCKVYISNLLMFIIMISFFINEKY